MCVRACVRFPFFPQRKLSVKCLNDWPGITELVSGTARIYNLTTILMLHFLLCNETIITWKTRTVCLKPTGVWRQGHTFIPNVVLPKWYKLSESECFHLQNERPDKIISNMHSISKMFLAFIDNLKCNAIQCNATWCSWIRLLDGSYKRKRKKKVSSKNSKLHK